MTWREVRDEMSVDGPMREDEEEEEEVAAGEEIPPVETQFGDNNVSTSIVNTLPAYDAHDETDDETK